MEPEHTRFVNRDIREAAETLEDRGYDCRSELHEGGIEVECSKDYGNGDGSIVELSGYALNYHPEGGILP